MLSPEWESIAHIPDRATIPEKEKTLFISLLQGFQRECQSAGLTMSDLTISRMYETLEPTVGACTWGAFRKKLLELQGRVIDEMSLRLFMSISAGKDKFFNNSDLFGQDVTKCFPSAIIDIEEAGKCLALGRNTACVFHLMRVMESGLRVLAKTLNDERINPEKNPSWDNILKKFKEELTKDRQKRAPEWAADDTFFSGVAATLMAIKDAWRNPTMHIEINYDEERALDVWNHVGHFMRHLATKLSESPK